MASRTPTIEQHPDIMAMRERYDQTAESPVARIIEGLGFLAGLWLAMSPWVVGFADETGITVSNLFTGLAVALLALGFASAFGRTHNLAWVTPLLGLWTILSPWLVADTDQTARVIVNNLLVGIPILVLGLLALGAGVARSRR
jgi:hypothetical protein